jgi:hypothetical protein
MKQMKRAKGEAHESPKMLHHLEVTPTENEGHVVGHHFKSGEGGKYHEPEMHSFGPDEGQQAMDHIASAANIKMEPSESEGEEMGQTNEEAEG